MKKRSRTKPQPQVDTVRTRDRRAIPLKDFCWSLGVSYFSGRRAIASGKLRAVRFGSLILIPVEEADRVMREGL